MKNCKNCTKLEKLLQKSIGTTNEALDFSGDLIKKHFSELGKKSWEKRKAKLLEETKTKVR